jgi:hypothetical protein
MVDTDLGLSRAPWRKSSFSGNGNECVEVAVAGGLVGVRDTANRAGGLLAFPAVVWHAFAAQVREGWS